MQFCKLFTLKDRPVKDRTDLGHVSNASGETNEHIK